VEPNQIDVVAVAVFRDLKKRFIHSRANSADVRVTSGHGLMI
jgi:hypothetical protein